MHLHKVGLYEKAGLAAAGTADNKNVFVSCILRLLRAAAHHQPFGLRQQHIIFKYRVDIRLYILRAAPTRGTVLRAFSVFLRVFAFHVNGKPDNDRPRNADKQIGGVQARRDTGKGGGKARPKLQELFACVCAGGKAYRCAYLVKQIDKEQIGQVEDLGNG